VISDAVVLVVAMAYPSVMTWLEFIVLPGGGQHDNPVLFCVFAAGKAAQFGLPLVYVWLREPGSVRPSRPTARGLRLGTAFGLVVGAGIIGLYFVWLRYTPLMTDTPARVHGWLAHMHLTTPAGFLAMAAFMSVLHSFLEEYYWRWFVFGWLRRHLPETAAMMLSSLAFMAHHVIILYVYLPGQFWTLAVPFSLCVAGGGIVWAWLYARTGSLYAPWVSHMLVDAALMVVGYEMVVRYWVD
jgi:membrane protease YdiL (CAAX protease family)